MIYQFGSELSVKKIECEAMRGAVEKNLEKSVDALGRGCDMNCFGDTHTFS